MFLFFFIRKIGNIQAVVSAADQKRWGKGVARTVSSNKFIFLETKSENTCPGKERQPLYAGLPHPDQGQSAEFFCRLCQKPSQRTG